MKILCVGNSKGGVGKTTITCNLAIELKKLGKKVLLLDLDPQCDLTRLLLQEEPATETIYDVLTQSTTIDLCILQITEGLCIVPGSLSAFLPISKKKFQFNRLKQALFSPEVLEYGFDFILIDMPPGINESSTLGYIAADGVLVVVTPEPFSLDNVTRYLTMIEQIQETWNPDLHVVGICVNRVDLRRTLTKNVLKDLNKHFRHYLLNTYLSNDTAVPNSHENKTFVCGLHWWPKIATQFKRLAKELNDKL